MPAPLPQQVVYDSAYFLAMFERLYPQSYLEALKGGDGYELFQAFAALGQRISLAKARVDQQAFINTSTGGMRARGVVKFIRPTGPVPGSEPAFTLLAGTKVETTNGGRVFVTTFDVVWGLGELGPKTVPVQAVAAGYEWNTQGQVTTAAGEVLPGEITQVVFLNENPPVIDVTLTVYQETPTTGGLPAALDQLGQDRGLPRNPNEADAPYRHRILRLPDTVTPYAILRVINSYLIAYDAIPGFVETFEPALSGCYDFPGNDGVFVPDYEPPGGPGNLVLDETTLNGAFIITVPNMLLCDCGFVLDEPANNLAELTSSAFEGAPLPPPATALAGRRGIAAYDLPQSADADLPGVSDGVDLCKQAVYAGLAELVRRVKAGGVAVYFMLQPD